MIFFIILQVVLCLGYTAGKSLKDQTCWNSLEKLKKNCCESKQKDRSLQDTHNQLPAKEGEEQQYKQPSSSFEFKEECTLVIRRHGVNEADYKDENICSCKDTVVGDHTEEDVIDSHHIKSDHNDNRGPDSDNLQNTPDFKGQKISHPLPLKRVNITPVLNAFKEYSLQLTCIHKDGHDKSDETVKNKEKSQEYHSEEGNNCSCKYVTAGKDRTLQGVLVAGNDHDFGCNTNTLPIIVAGIGGFLLGIVICAIVMLLIMRRKRRTGTSDSKHFQREKDINVGKNKSEHFQITGECEATFGVVKSGEGEKTARFDNSAGVYNHLYEKPEAEEKDYDHASPVPNLPTPNDNYTHAVFEQPRNESHSDRMTNLSVANSKQEGDDTKDTLNSEYFILEKIVQES